MEAPEKEPEMKARTRLTLQIFCAAALLLAGWLTYEDQVLFCYPFVFIVLGFLLLITAGSLMVWLWLLKRNKLVLCSAILLAVVIVLSFYVYGTFRMGSLSFLSPKNPTDNQILTMIISNILDLREGRPMVVVPGDSVSGVKIFEQKYPQYASLLDRFFENNNPTHFTLQPGPDDHFSVDYTKTAKIRLDNTTLVIGMSAPAYDPHSGYIIEYWGNQNGGYLNLYRYKLGKFIQVDTLYSWNN